MKVFEIKHRFIEKILFRAETESLKSCLEAGIGMDANLRSANLRDADLRSANLRDADLRGVDLRGAILSGANLKGADLIGADLIGADLRYVDLGGVDLGGVDLRGAYIQGPSSETIEIKETPLQILGMSWDIIVFDSHMKIGCEFHSIKDWSEYDDERIERMHNEAKEWWGNHKKMIMDFCDMNERR